MNDLIWKAESGLSFEDWRADLYKLLAVHEKLPWAIGDCLNYGEQEFGDRFLQALPEDGKQRKTLLDYKYVAGYVMYSRRRENLTFTHHREVAALESHEQDEWLSRAEEDGLSTRDLREAIQEAPRPQTEVIPPDNLDRLKKAFLALNDKAKEQFWTWLNDTYKPTGQYGDFDPVRDLPLSLRR